MVQEGRRSRPCLTKPHLPGADVKKLLDDVKDTTWFDWQGNPLHQVRQWTAGLPTSAVADSWAP